MGHITSITSTSFTILPQRNPAHFNHKLKVSIFTQVTHVKYKLYMQGIPFSPPKQLKKCKVGQKVAFTRITRMGIMEVRLHLCPESCKILTTLTITISSRTEMTRFLQWNLNLNNTSCNYYCFEIKLKPLVLYT